MSNYVDMEAWRRAQPEELANLRRVVKQARETLDRPKRRRAPLARAFIDSGMQGGYVFETTRKDLVVRVGPLDSLENEAGLLREEFAGGVVKVSELIVLGNHVITWKERISENVQWFIQKSLPEDRALDILDALNGICWKGNRAWVTSIDTLATWDGTLFFARALAAGLPCNDIDLDHNLGVTRDGRVVAFDL